MVSSIKHALGILICLTMTPYANALSVPFQTVSLAPGTSLQASYSFGNFSMIFCFNDSTNINSTVTWPYKGILRASQLPVFLKDNANFEGFFADKNGIITLTNTTNTRLAYSCVFGY